MTAWTKEAQAVDRRGFGYVTADTCEKLDNIGEMVACIEQAFRWQASGGAGLTVSDPPALHLNDRESGYYAHGKMVCLPEIDVAGSRSVGYLKKPNGDRPRLGRMTRLVLLSDMKTAAPFALVDERHNYTLRTAGAVAAPARYLMPEKPVLGVIGAGLVANAAVRMFDAVLPLSSILVTSRRRESREALMADTAPKISAPIEAADSIADVMQRANIIVVATTSTQPLITWADVRPGMLICALGNNELDPEVYAKADKVMVDDWGQSRTKADVKPLIESGALDRDRLHGELGDLITGAIPGREREDEVIVIRTEGLASQDVSLAFLSYMEARRRSLVDWIIPPDLDTAGLLDD